MKTSDSINELATALAKAQGEMSPAIFDSLNPHYKSRYASLASIMSACKLPMSRHGLAMSQAVSIDGGVTTVNTRLMHSSGQWIQSVYPVKPVKDDPQGLGSALTYAKRYSLSSLVGIVADSDDDAELSMARPEPKKEIKNMAPAQATLTQAVLTTTAPEAVPAPPARNPMHVPDKSFSNAIPPNIKEMMKMPSPNHDPSGDYSPTFGKYKGMKLRDITVFDLNGYVKYMKGSSVDGRPLSKSASEFIQEAEKFLETRAPKNLVEQTKEKQEEINQEFAAANSSWAQEECPF